MPFANSLWERLQSALLRAVLILIGLLIFSAGTIGTPTLCWRCHEAEADPSLQAHQSASYPLCDSCHRPTSWVIPNYPH